MSRRLTGPPFAAPRPVPTVLLPEHASPMPAVTRTPAPPDPPDATDPDPRRGPHRCGRTRLLVVACVLAVLAAAGTTVLAIGVIGPTDAAAAPEPRPTPYEAKQFDIAVGVEGGVHPLVSDRVQEIEGISSITVTRNPDPLPATAYLLAPIGEPRAQVILTSAPELPDFVPDGWLTDGRPYAMRSADAPYVAFTTVGSAGQFLEVFGRSMDLDELLAVTTETSVALTSILQVPEGWTLRATSPMPPWIHGFRTRYELAGGRALTIGVERASPGRATLAEFGPMEPIDLGTGGWAYRHPGPVDGVLFERGDVAVEVMGTFTDDELRMIAHSVREMAPGEHRITEPDPDMWPPPPLEQVVAGHPVPGPR